MDELLAKYQNNPELADQLCEGVGLPDAESKSELAAWTVVGNVLYNLDVTKTRE